MSDVVRERTDLDLYKAVARNMISLTPFNSTTEVVISGHANRLT